MESQQEVVAFEEQEVLWAKIRGYPWWPSFVDKVHQKIDEQDEQQYTVFFFGDNTHARLGASKLRKFSQYYSQCFQKAKTHRKLMTSILKAEEKLKQNDQNIQIFEQFRSSIKPKKSKSGQKSNSKISSQDIEQLEQPNSIAKSHTNSLRENNKKKHLRSTTNKHQQKEQNNEMIDENSPQDIEIKIKPAQINLLDNRKTRTTRSKSIYQVPKQSQEIFEEESDEVQKVEINQGKISIDKKSTKKKEQPQQKIQQEIEQSSEQFQSQNLPLKPKTRQNNIKPRALEQTTQRKRGRPKKVLKEEQQNDEKSVDSPEYPRTRDFPKKKITIKKIIRASNRPLHHHSQQKIELKSTLTKKDQGILSHIKEIINEREDLIEYLSTIEITTNNVKEILDLDVSTILQEGDITNQITHLLEYLKAALLFKYFPDDLKHKKKYQKMIKKKPIQTQQRQQLSQLKNQSSAQQQQIRKKTKIKLQKFLRQYPEISSKAKQMAVEIERYFEEIDQNVGDKYKSVAFTVLKTLKTKSQSYSEVRKKLEDRTYF